MLASRCQVWAIVTAALMAARSELLGDQKTRWKEVWAVIGQGFGEAKRAAAEGVEAIKAEAGLYAFALGERCASSRCTRMSGRPTAFQHAALSVDAAVSRLDLEKPEAVAGRQARNARTRRRAGSARAA